MRKPTLLTAAIAAAFMGAGAPRRVPGRHSTSTEPDQSAYPVYPRAPDLEWRDPAPEDSMDIQSIATLPDGERIGDVYQLVSPNDVSAGRPRPPN